MCPMTWLTGQFVDRFRVMSLFYGSLVHFFQVSMHFGILSFLSIVLTFNVKCSQKVNVGRRIKAVFAIYITYP